MECFPRVNYMFSFTYFPFTNSPHRRFEVGEYFTSATYAVGQLVAPSPLGVIAHSMDKKVPGPLPAHPPYEEAVRIW